jgi:hypothetical protein
MKKLLCSLLASSLLLVACMREPDLHLYEAADADIVLPMVDLTLDYYWELAYGIDYDWQAEWWYGWDERDKELFGDLEPAPPTEYNLRRYYTGSIPLGPHLYVLSDMVYGDTFHGRYEWGFWDALVWNNIKTVDGVQSLNFDEQTSLDYVTAYTNQTMRSTRYSAPLFTRSFWAPEPLFAAYDQAIEINPNLDGFEYDAVRGVYVKKLNMELRPLTYIYLTQVILHHNNGRIAASEGTSNLSGMARSVTLNNGQAGNDAITVYYETLLKKNCDMEGENVDIIGGRLLTFGICGLRPNAIRRADEIKDVNRHYMDVTVQFNNGMDSTMVFDVTDQVRKHYKGGVITVELDLDTVPIPQRSGGSGFDAVVEDFEEKTYEFEM